MSHYLARATRQIDQEIELFRGQAHFSVVHVNGVRLQVNPEMADYDRALFGWLGLHGPPEGCAHSRQQLRHAEWLGYVIVSAGVQGFDFDLVFAFYG